MGVITRLQGAAYVICSDRSSTDNPTNSAPKGLPSFEVWTGEKWSAVMADAKTFSSLDEGDEYIRANFAKVTGLVSPPQKPSVRRPRQRPS